MSHYQILTYLFFVFFLQSKRKHEQLQKQSKEEEEIQRKQEKQREIEQKAQQKYKDWLQKKNQEKIEMEKKEKVMWIFLKYSAYNENIFQLNVMLLLISQKDSDRSLFVDRRKLL